MEVDMVSPVHLLQGLASLRVTDVFRPKNSKVLILTFDTKGARESVTAAFLRYSVRLVGPLPRHCSRCQRYGHKAGRCRTPEERCSMCGEEGHRKQSAWPPLHPVWPAVAHM